MEDERNIRELIVYTLESSGFTARGLESGKELNAAIAEQLPDLILLDIMLPDIDGFQILKQIRQKYTFPVIMLTAKTEYMDKITGLTLGADDYIPKPFRMMELISRVRALLRRSEDNGAEEYRMENLYVCPGRHEVTVDQEPVNLTLKEYEMLCLLLKNSGTVLSRTQLLNQIWGYEYVGDTRTVDVHIKRLREKIKDHNGWSLSTVWGIGYKFEVK